MIPLDDLFQRARTKLATDSMTAGDWWGLADALVACEDPRGEQLRLRTNLDQGVVRGAEAATAIRVLGLRPFDGLEIFPSAFGHGFVPTGGDDVGRLRAWLDEPGRELVYCLTSGWYQGLDASRLVALVHDPVMRRFSSVHLAAPPLTDALATALSRSPHLRPRRLAVSPVKPHSLTSCHWLWEGGWPLHWLTTRDVPMSWTDIGHLIDEVPTLQRLDISLGDDLGPNYTRDASLEPRLHLRIERRRGQRALPALAHQAWLRAVRRLVARAHYAADLLGLVGSPYLSRLTELFVAVDERLQLAAMLDAAALTHLRVQGPVDLTALPGHSRLPGLQQLVLIDPKLGVHETVTLAECVSDTVRDVRTVQVPWSGAPLKRLTARPLRARSVQLAKAGIDDEDARVLAGWPGLQGVRALGLSGNHIGMPGLRALMESPFLTGLEHLDLAGNPLGRDAVDAVAGGDAWPRLRGLRLVEFVPGSGFFDAFDALAERGIDYWEFPQGWQALPAGTL